MSDMEILTNEEFCRLFVEVDDRLRAEFLRDGGPDELRKFVARRDTHEYGDGCPPGYQLRFRAEYAEGRTGGVRGKWVGFRDPWGLVHLAQYESRGAAIAAAESHHEAHKEIHDRWGTYWRRIFEGLTGQKLARVSDMTLKQLRLFHARLKKREEKRTAA